MVEKTSTSIHQTKSKFSTVAVAVVCFVIQLRRPSMDGFLLGPGSLAVPAMSFEDGLRRVEEHVATVEGPHNPIKGSRREYIGCQKNTLAAGNEPSAI